MSEINPIQNEHGKWVCHEQCIYQDPERGVVRHFPCTKTHPGMKCWPKLEALLSQRDDEIERLKTKLTIETKLRKAAQDFNSKVTEPKLAAALKRERELQREVCQLKYVTADILPDDYAKSRDWSDNLFEGGE